MKVRLNFSVPMLHLESFENLIDSVTKKNETVAYAVVRVGVAEGGLLPPTNAPHSV